MAEKLSEKIYNSIRKEIEEGRLDSREFFSEAQIAEKYQVSKAPVRDALHLLASEGYLVSYHRKGYMVNSYSVDEINQIQMIRRALEHLSVDLVIKNASDKDLQELYSRVDGMENLDFHLSLARLSGNKYLPDALEGFLSKIYVAVRRRRELESVHHKELVEALIARDAERAQKCITEDIEFL